MSLRHELRRFVHRFGIDIVRYPLHDHAARTAKLIESRDIDCVIDVGANDGGFATALRDCGYQGRIISFEPLSEPHKRLSEKAKTDPNWSTLKSAIGDTDGNVTINVAANSGQSSSVLPMLSSHSDVAPESAYIGTETAVQRRLDSVLPQLGISPDAGSRAFLKVDVQGYECAVLDGAAALLASGVILGLQLELSLTPLYRGAMTYREAIDRAEGLGMTLMGLEPVFADPRTGQLLQADGVFFTE